MPKNKVVTLEQAMEKCFDGMTVLLPGFVNCGVSETLIDGLMQKGIKDLNIISKLFEGKHIRDLEPPSAKTYEVEGDAVLWRQSAHYYKFCFPSK